MTCRSLLWITAAAVTVGAVASTPAIAGADPDPGWNVTIDEPATSEVASKTLRIEGTAANVLQPENVTVTLVPQEGMPAECTPAPGTAPVDGDQRYSIELPVLCNGPHQIQVVAHDDLGLSSGGPAIRTIGVAEPPARPVHPELDETTEGGLIVTWERTSDLDAAGSVLFVNGRDITVARGVAEYTLGPSDRRSSVGVRALRWGAGGPGTTVSSPPSAENLLPLDNPNPPTNTEPPPSQPKTPDPPAATPPPSTPGPSGTAPPSTGGSSTVPTRGTGATSTTLPEGYSEELPFGAPDDAFVPGSEPNRRPSSETEERAVSTAAPAGGLVTTTEKRSPGLVAPFALGLLMITIAAHIAWYLRRSRPTAGGQVRAT